MSATDRVIIGAARTTVALLAGVGGAISYWRMAELARLHGEMGWRAHAFQVSVSVIEVVASLVPGSAMMWIAAGALRAAAEL